MHVHLSSATNRPFDVTLHAQYERKCNPGGHNTCRLKSGLSLLLHTTLKGWLAAEGMVKTENSIIHV
jgi:hypothetical protein